jgi:hypothetical protein
MMTVIETPLFSHQAKQIWVDSEREEFVNWIAENPHSGDVMPGFSGLRKVRWSRAGMGKRGGVRVIYVSRNQRGELLLLTVYAKTERENISQAALKELAKLYRD